MLLQTIALVFYAAALLIVLIFGHSWPFGALLFRINPGGLNTLQAGIQRHLSPLLWDVVFMPLLLLPAWVVPVALGTVCIVISALRRDHG